MNSYNKLASKIIDGLSNEIANSPLLTTKDYNALCALTKHMANVAHRDSNAVHTVSDGTLMGTLKILLKVLKYGKALTHELQEAHDLTRRISLAVIGDQDADEKSYATDLLSLQRLLIPHSSENSYYCPGPGMGIRKSQRIRMIDNREVAFSPDVLIATVD